MSAADRIDIFFEWFFNIFYSIPKPIRWLIAPFLSLFVIAILISAFIIFIPIIASLAVVEFIYERI